jgi:hypothetical protein
VANYRVRFVKELCDHTGHQHKCIEGIVDICRAHDRNRAIQAAKRRFERMKGIPRWDLYADTFEVDLDTSEPIPPRRSPPR